MNKSEIREREKKKYNLLHSGSAKYGGRSARGKMFMRNNDNFHQRVKKIFKESKTALDVGCGKGFFIDFFSSQFKNLQISGCDISDECAKFRPDLLIAVCDASELPYKDNQFDIALHMDGMEHIPVEIEQDVIRELVRVSKNYVYMTIATHEVKHHDDVYINLGLGAVHINMKTAEEWFNFLKDFSIDNGFIIRGFENYTDWVHVLLEVK